MYLQEVRKSFMSSINRAKLIAGLLFFLSSPAIAAAVDTTRDDPLVGFHFGLEVEGKVTGYFTEVSGLGSETDVVEHKVVNDKGQEVVMKIPGRLKWTDVTLSRGITTNLDMWTWRKQVEDGDIDGARSNFSIIMYDQALTEIARWNFTNGWPSKLTAPTGSSSGIGVETITIVHEHMERIN
jgi:phage tail-like protein